MTFTDYTNRENIFILNSKRDGSKWSNFFLRLIIYGSTLYYGALNDYIILPRLLLKFPFHPLWLCCNTFQ